MPSTKRTRTRSGLRLRPGGRSSFHDLSNGRFGPFGLGAGGIGFIQRGHGIVIEKPLARAKETVAIVRGLLKQKKFPYDGQWFKPHDFHLRAGPIGEGTPPIWLAGLGPKIMGGSSQLINAKYAGVWELPVLGAVTAPTALLIRPDGYVAWVGDPLDMGLPDALTTWFGPPSAA